MPLLGREIEESMARASWIRRMFEAGLELKKQFGAEHVFDFSLGNPDLPPPPAVVRAFATLATEIDRPLGVGYMPNAGYPEVRARLAAALACEQTVPMQPTHVVLTCGAAGGLNALFRAILDPGDEVVCPAPYFVEYGFYVANFGGILRPVPSSADGFDPDLAAMAAAITPRTRAVLINSPNNPTGKIYSAAALQALADLLRLHAARAPRPIYLVSDEPYRFLAYDGCRVPPVLPLYPHSVVVGSFSKSLSLAGERVGYVAVNPGMPEALHLVDGVILTNRILGYVNAPALGQRLLVQALGAGVDVKVYDERREAMAAVLRAAGIEFFMPQGAFYFFPRAPGGDDLAWVNRLMAQRILAVPGSGFGFPGFFRLTFCVDRRVIERSADGFLAAARG